MANNLKAFLSLKGANKIVEGDSLSLLKTIPSGRIAAVITDPPYNVGKDYGGHNDSMSEKEYAAWCAEIVKECTRIAPIQFWVAPRYKLGLWLKLLPKSHLIVIPRGASGPFRQGWSDQFEIALAVGLPTGAPSDLWSGIRLKGEGYFFREETYGHPGYTPLPILRRAVEFLTKKDDLILDPFIGTGTTAEACVRSGRKYLGIERNPKYVEIAERRIRSIQPSLSDEMLA